MDVDSQEQSAEREEIHFLAAMLEELMRSLLAKGLMTREEIQKVENTVSAKMGTAPRAW